MTPDYQKGYKAGRKRSTVDAKEMQELRFKNEKLRQAMNDRRDNIYMQCLDMTLNHCNGWSIGDKTINSAEGYCRLAKIFADNSISTLSK